MQLTKEQLGELQSVELDIFKSFVEVCEQLGVRYYLLAGTLLGAVRHKGFIPWDDDIDVGILREDYENFLEKAGAGEFCFVENCEIAPYLDRIEEVWVYRWNRHYPADARFPMDAVRARWRLKGTCDFPGSSHEMITEEVYGL